MKVVKYLKERIETLEEYVGVTERDIKKYKKWLKEVEENKK